MKKYSLLEKVENLVSDNILEMFNYLFMEVVSDKAWVVNNTTILNKYEMITSLINNNVWHDRLVDATVFIESDSNLVNEYTEYTDDFDIRDIRSIVQQAINNLHDDVINYNGEIIILNNHTMNIIISEYIVDLVNKNVGKNIFSIVK